MEFNLLNWNALIIFIDKLNLKLFELTVIPIY